MEGDRSRLKLILKVWKLMVLKRRSLQIRLKYWKIKTIIGFKIILACKGEWVQYRLERLKRLTFHKLNLAVKREKLIRKRKADYNNNNKMRTL
jgi:hypothetical protein